MANYMATTRSNYFRVTDEAGFKEFMSHVKTEWDDIKLFSRYAKDGTTFFAFGGEGSIVGYVEDEDDDAEYDVANEKFIDGLQKYVASDDSIIILESGHEKLRYVTGFATVITRDKICTADIHNVAVRIAREALGDPEYHTCTGE